MERANVTTNKEPVLTVEFLGELYYTTAGAMKELNFTSASAVSREIKAGNLRVFKHNRENYFSREALEEYILRKTVKLPRK